MQAGRQIWIDRVRSALEGQGRRPVIEYLQRQRWFGGKGKPLADARLLDAIELSIGDAPRLLALLLAEYRGGAQERYLVPLSVRPKAASDDAAAIVELSESSGPQWVCDATREDDIWRSLYAIVASGREVAGQTGSILGRTMPGREKDMAGSASEVKVLSAEQSNTSVVFDRRVIMKLIRKVEMGVNPDSEVLEFLTTKTTCGDIPPLLGIMTYHDSQAEEAPEGTIGVIQRFIPNKGDGWSYTLAHLDEWLEKAGGTGQGLAGHPSNAVRDMSDAFLEEIRRLGTITGNLHLALASNAEAEAFRPESITALDVERWQRKMTHFLADVCCDLRGLSAEQRAMAGLSPDEADILEAACRNRFGDLGLLVKGPSVKIRHHGDYHLGQVLKTDEGFVVIDFEGEPARPLEERRAKVCPLKDVAGMLRSFNYAAQAALKRRPSVTAADGAIMTEWEGAARTAFLDGYRSVAKPGQAEFLPPAWEDTERVLRVYELDKALYELRYELRNRPEWLSIPLQGIRGLSREGAS